MKLRIKAISLLINQSKYDKREKLKHYKNFHHIFFIYLYFLTEIQDYFARFNFISSPVIRSVRKMSRNKVQKLKRLLEIARSRECVWM